MSLSLLYLQYFLVFFLIILFVSFSGNLIYNLLTPAGRTAKKYAELLYSLLIGIVALVSIFSIITTGFKTINLLFILLFFLYLHRAKYHFNWSKAIFKEGTLFIKKHIVFILIFSLIFYLYEAIWYFKPGEFNLIIPFVDYVDMYNISQIISQTGQENNKYLISNYYYPQFHGIAPYHFFELWLNGFLSTVLPISGTLTLMLFVYPIFYFASYIGLMAVWEYYGTVNIYKKIISLFLLFVGGMYFDFYNKYELLKWYGGNVGNIAQIWGKKSAILYPFIFTAYISFLNKKFLTTLSLLLCLCIVSIGVMPGVLGGLFLFLILNFLHKTLDKKQLIQGYTAYIIFVAAFLVLYFIWGNKNEESLGFSNIVMGFLEGFDMTFAKTVFFRILFPVLRLIVIYSPYLIFIFFVLLIKSSFGTNTLKELKQLLILICLILFVGSIVGAIASINIFSGGQFFGYLLPLLLIFVLLCFAKEFTSFKINIGYFKNNKSFILSKAKNLFINKLRYFLIKIQNAETAFIQKRIIFFQIPFLLFFVVSGSYNLYNNIKLQKVYKTYSLNLYSNSYLKDVTTYLNTHKINPLGVCFMGEEDRKKYPLNAYGLTGITFSGMSLKLTNNFHAVSNLSIFDIAIDTTDTFSKSLFKSFEFYNYVKDIKEKQVFTTYEDAQIDFINNFNIDFALIYKNGLLPPELEDSIVLSYSDPLSGQRFVVFK